MNHRARNAEEIAADFEPRQRVSIGHEHHVDSQRPQSPGQEKCPWRTVGFGHGRTGVDDAEPRQKDNGRCSIGKILGCRLQMSLAERCSADGVAGDSTPRRIAANQGLDRLPENDVVGGQVVTCFPAGEDIEIVTMSAPLVPQA